MAKSQRPVVMDKLKLSSSERCSKLDMPTKYQCLIDIMILIPRAILLYH
jgi:hypothetical protein